MQLDVPDHAKAQAALLNNVGIAAARENGDAQHAGIAMLRRAVALNPLDLGHRLNLANFLLELGADEEAEEIVTFVLKHDQRSAGAWQYMGVLATNRGRMDEAIGCFRRAYEIDPGNGQRKFDLAAALLRAGNFQEGLPLYEDRDKILPRTGAPPDAPTWTGEKTGHLAIWPDQGYGDLIMFARFLPWAKERADKITFLVNPLTLPLFQGYAAIADVAAVYAADAKFDHQIRVSSIPLVYGLTPDNIPPDPGLITVAASEGRLGGPGLKIGIAWQGNPQFPGDRMRSIPFREFLPLAADPRNTVIGLQVGAAAADIARARAQRIVRDMSSDIEGEWSHAAALIKNLDLVVTSCTAIAHLAGALGVPTFVMLPLFADWRWLSGRDDTPWYPHTRLFRQTKVGDWKSVMTRVMTAVHQVHRQRAVVSMLGNAAPPTPFDPATMRDMNAPGTADEKEPDVAKALRKILRPGDAFVDVGANVGMHTVLAAELVGIAGLVVAIEPGENALPDLRKACEDLVQVRIVPQPLWSKAKEITFHLCADGSGGNAVWDPGKFPSNHATRAAPHKTKLAATTLDIECEKRSLSPRLIKIDTEGAEERVLRGATRLLFEHKPPFIIAEFHPFGLRELGCSEATLRAFMAKAGYATFHLFADGSRPYRLRDDEPIRTPGGFIVNLLFSTEDMVNALWTEASTDSVRAIYGYKVVEKASESAA